MKISSDRILTTHAGSLPRPDELIEANGVPATNVHSRKSSQRQWREVVRQQRDTGVDIPGDGEFGKSMGQRVNYGAWWRYSFNRLGGLDLDGPDLHEMAPKRSRPGDVVLTSFATVAIAPGSRGLRDPDCGDHYRAAPWPSGRSASAGPYTGHDAIKADIANFKAALAGRRRRGGIHDLGRPGQRLADRQRLLQERRGIPVRLRRGDARGIQGDRRCRADPAARRSGDRRELGHGQPGADGRGIQEVHDGPGRGAEPCDPGPARRTGSASTCAGAAGTGRTSPTSRCATSSMSCWRSRPGLFIRGRQCPPRARMEGLAGRQAPRRQDRSCRGSSATPRTSSSIPNSSPSASCASPIWSAASGSSLLPIAGSAAASIRRLPGPSSLRLPRGLR